MISKNLTKFTLVVVSLYLMIQIYLIFGTWLTKTLTVIFFLLLPFIAGYFVSIMIAPTLNKISKFTKIKPSLLLSLFLLTLISLITMAGAMLITEIYHQITSIAAMVVNATDVNIQRIDEISNKFGFDLGVTSNLTTTVQNVAQFFVSHSDVISTITSSFFSSVISIVSFLLFFILTLFYTIDSVTEKKEKHLCTLKEKGFSEFAALLEKVEKIFRYYFRGMFISMIFVATGSSIGFWILRLPNPVGLGIMCGLFNIIPLIGPYIGAFPAGFVALSHGWLQLVYVILIVLIVQQIEGNFVTPNVQGKFLNIQPLSIIGGIVVFGYFFGVLGMVFAAPIAGITKVTVLYLKDKIPTFMKWWNKIVHST